MRLMFSKVNQLDGKVQKQLDENMAEVTKQLDQNKAEVKKQLAACETKLDHLMFKLDALIATSDSVAKSKANLEPETEHCGGDPELDPEPEPEAEC